LRYLFFTLGGDDIGCMLLSISPFPSPSDSPMYK